MPLVTFKDVCIDATDTEVLSQWLAPVLGLAIDPPDPGDPDRCLVGPDPSHTIWINQVPEPKTIKNRVHLDVRATSLEPFAALPTIPTAPDDAWTTFQDPFGNEFCVFTYESVPAQRMKAVEVDAVDAVAITDWWQEVLGGTATHEDGWSALEHVPGMPGEGFDFADVPEPKTLKNRMHWDVTLNDGVGIDDLVARGATVLRPSDEQNGDEQIRWTVMADPEGNEFCVFD